MSGMTASNIGCGSHLKTSSMLKNEEIDELSEISSNGEDKINDNLDNRLNDIRNNFTFEHQECA